MIESPNLDHSQDCVGGVFSSIRYTCCCSFGWSGQRHFRRRLLLIGRGAKDEKWSQSLGLPETPKSKVRESGLVVRLFPNPPQIFGAPRVQPVSQENDKQRGGNDTLAGTELRPLEAEALSLSRMLKNLEPQEFSFPTAGLSTEAESPPSTPGKYAKTSVENFGGEGGYGRTDDSTVPRSPRGAPLGAREKNDLVHPFSTGSYGNMLLSPTKSPVRRTPSGLTFPSSRGSTPSSSFGSAAELQFPVALQSPASPEPLRPGSPLKWNSRVLPVEDIPVPEGVRETPVNGLVARISSFATYIPYSVSTKLSFESVPEERTSSNSATELSAVAQKLQQQGHGNSEAEEKMLNSMLPLVFSNVDPDRLDFSFADEYRGPPISHDVPKANPLDLTAVRSSDDAYPPSYAVAPPSPSGPKTSRRTIPPLILPSAEVVTSSLFTAPVSFASEVSSESPRLKRPPRTRKSNSEVPQLVREQNFGDVKPTGGSSPESGPEIHPRTRRNSVDYAPSDKDYSLSKCHSFRDGRETLSLSKSESGLYQKDPAGYTGDDSRHQAGQRLRAASLPGTQQATFGSSSNMGSHRSSNIQSELEIPPQQRRKGECWLCRKGHWLTDKEACLVCSAKYCYNCILTAMESMPEGRKCKQCVGKPVDETRRSSIGKPSRLLNRLLCPQEVQQIMKAEKECAANQLKAEQVWVNDRQLTAEELAVLLGCPNPPQKLKPGRYWYDKQCGLWGKDGERPDKLITPELKVGGNLSEKASKGTTQVYMNGRELGRLELKMLKFAGVHCTPKTYLLVDPDGSYLEEGTKKSKGNIWKKTSIRFLYPFFSLPTPGPSPRNTKDDQRDCPDVYLPDYIAQNKVHKLLLLGHEGSGRSTVFKQTKFLFKDGFEHEEKQKMKAMIQCNIFRYASILLEGRERFEEDDDELVESTSYGSENNFIENESAGVRRNIYALDERLKKQADFFLEVMAEGELEAFFPASSREYAPVVEELWRDPALKATYKRKDELIGLPDSADYFLDKVMEFSSNEYVPSDEDILLSEGLAQGSGLAEVEFSLDDSNPLYQDAESSSPERYQLIKVGGNGMAEGCKWLDMFEDVHAVIFCVAISDYDQVCPDVDGVLRSRLRQTELFDSVLKHPVLKEKPYVLLLNKYDLFEDKFCKDVPLTTCEWFTDFKPVGASQMTPQMQAQLAYTYVVHKYKELFAISGHKVFTFKLVATEQEKVFGAFQYVRETLKWKDNSAYDLLEESSYSTDLSSYSQHMMSAGRDDHNAERVV
ncbi:hypothetical protein R1flu_009830 [Riccia fluitans]|uniref:Uncharacterized protein n=1 Tax=Riccia fluitans TaxID=41844 RepID=A0ABD1Z425_9MARC